MSRLKSRWLLALFGLVVSGLAAYGGWWIYGRPQALANVDHPKLQCVSYAPFREGQSPFDPKFVVPAWQIEEDLRVLAEKFDCIRTYSVGQGLDQVPAIAKKHGLEVLLGIWIGGERGTPGSNAREVEAALRIANDPALAGTIKAVIVGNEVLLRRDLSQAQLVEWIARVRGKVPVPVTYADVWEFWQHYPTMADAVDYMTVHILPFWEDEPVDVAHSIAHLRDVLARMRADFPGRTMFIGETGWPSAGRMREGAAPGRVNQARYIREFVLAVESEGIGYNLIEAFDQPWKRRQEGTVGGEWGIFDVGRQLKFPFAGPVSEDPNWRRHAAASLAIAAALMLTLAARGLALGPLGWLVAGLAANAAGASLVHGWIYVGTVSHTWSAWAVNLLTLGLAALAALALFAAIGDRLAGRGDASSRPAALGDVIDRIRRIGRERLDRAVLLGLLQALTVFGVASLSVQLVFDPRYRDFPVSLYLVPAAGFALLAWLQRHERAAADRREERWLAVLACIATVVTAIKEGPLNIEALGWMVVALLAVAPWLYDAWRARQASRRVALAAAD